MLNSTGEIFDIVSSSNSIGLKHDPAFEFQKMLTSKPPVYVSTSSMLNQPTSEHNQILPPSLPPKKNSYREKKPMSFKKVKELHQIGED